MTTKTGYYVTARDGGAGKTAWLVGPFQTHRAARLMVPAVRYAARLRLTDPRFRFADYGVHKLRANKLPAGSLDLAASVDDGWVKLVIMASST
jgi:hypothetical protein